MMKLHVFAMAALIGFGTLPVLSQAADVPEGPHITTVGTSQFDVKAELATLVFNVSIVSPTAANAKKLADQRVAKYVEFLSKNGIEKSDIDAANVSTEQDYEYSNSTRKFAGYSAVRSVTVTLRDLSKLNELLDGALEAHLNEIESVTFGVLKPELYREQARQAAIKNAIEQATSVAKGFGVQLGAVYSINYQSQSIESEQREIRYYYAAKAAMRPKAEIQHTYEQPKVYFSDNVSVVFNLGK